MAAIRVFHLITGLEVGGAERTLLQVLPRLGGERFEHSVYSLTSTGPVGRTLRDMGIPVRALGFRASRAPLGALRLLRALRRERPDILHAHMTHANIAARLSSRLVRVPIVICSERNSGAWKSRRLVRFERAIAGWADWYTAVSQSVADFLVEQQNVPHDRVSVIRNGVRLVPPLSAEQRAAVRRGLAVREGERLILSVGRVVPQKGYEHLIRAIPHVLKHEPSARFYVVGDVSRRKYADYHALLSELAAELNVSDRLEFLGVRDDVPILLGSADLFVMSSLWEGLPNALLEAMSAGVPAVTTDVDGAGEVGRMTTSAMLVPPRDPTALAQAILRLLGGPEEARRRAEAGRALVRTKFMWEATAEAIRNLYEKLLRARYDKPSAAR